MCMTRRRKNSCSSYVLKIRHVLKGLPRSRRLRLSVKCGRMSTGSTICGTGNGKQNQPEGANQMAIVNVNGTITRTFFDGKGAEVTESWKSNGETMSKRWAAFFDQPHGLS